MQHCQSTLRIHSAIASWNHSYFDNVMMKFIINNRTDTWKKLTLLIDYTVCNETFTKDSWLWPDAWSKVTVHLHIFTWLLKFWMFWVCPLSILVCPLSFQICLLSIHCWLWNDTFRKDSWLWPCTVKFCRLSFYIFVTTLLNS